MAKATQKENALSMFGNIPTVTKTNEEKFLDKLDKVSESKNIPYSVAKKIKDNYKEPKQVKGKISAYVNDDTLTDFKRLCKKRGLKYSDVLEDLIKIYVMG